MIFPAQPGGVTCMPGPPGFPCQDASTTLAYANAVITDAVNVYSNEKEPADVGRIALPGSGRAGDRLCSRAVRVSRYPDARARIPDPPRPPGRQAAQYGLQGAA